MLNLGSAGLGVVRSLARLGIPVTAMDYDHAATGRLSRWAEALRGPNPVTQHEELLDVLLEQARRMTGCPVLYPCSDAYTLFVSRHRERLEPAFRFVLPRPESHDVLVNKKKQFELARSVGLHLTDTHFPQSLDEVDSLARGLRYPVFVKPCVGHLWRQTFSGKGFLVKDAEELRYRFRQILPCGYEAMVQRIIPGPNTNHWKVSAYIGSDGRELAIMTTRKIRQYPVDFGVGTMMETMQNPELLEMGRKFFRAADYRGVGSIEFKQDAEDGRFKLIEMNPRYWIQNAIATTAGMNLPYLQYLDLTGQSPQPLTRSRDGVIWLDPVSDLQAIREYRKRGQLSLWSAGRSWLRASVWSTFAWDDPRPFLEELRQAFPRSRRRAAVRKLLSGFWRPRDTSTPAVEPWSSDRLRALVQTPHGFTVHDWRASLDEHWPGWEGHVELRCFSDTAEARRSLPAAEAYAGVTLESEVADLGYHLRYVHSLSANLDANRLALPPEVVLTSSSGLNAASLAEHALMFMLALDRGFGTARDHQRRWEWNPAPILANLRGLRGRTVGLIGLGPAGVEIARACQAFGMTVRALRRRPERGSPVAGVVVYASLREILGASDFLVIAAPLTAETRGLVGPREIAGLKRGSYVVNIGPADIVDLEALAGALRSGHVAGAAFDTLAEEPPPPEHPLRDAPRFLLTPHVAADMYTFRAEIRARFARNLRALVEGGSFEGVVERAVGRKDPASLGLVETAFREAQVQNHA